MRLFKFIHEVRFKIVQGFVGVRFSPLIIAFFFIESRFIDKIKSNREDLLIRVWILDGYHLLRIFNLLKELFEI